MIKRQSIKADKMASDPFPLWKEKPPGPEQLELERMFKNNAIELTATPDSVRKSNPIFQKFSTTVFASHFRKTKARLGLCANVGDEAQASIPELGAGASEILKASPIKTDDHSSMIEHQNSPFFTWVYTDHLRERDIVCVILPIISGCRDINFELSDDGSMVIINYSWPSALFKAKELFKEELAQNQFSLDHPKLHSFVSNWHNAGVTEKSCPKGRTINELPCKVKRENNSWTKKAKKINDDTKMILLEFTAHQNDLLIRDAERTRELNFKLIQ